MTDDLVEHVAKAICRENCAFYGEPPCWKLADDFVQEPWPPDCGEPGCFALAAAAISVALEKAAKVAEFNIDTLSPADEAGEWNGACEYIAAAIRAMIKP